MSLVSLIASEGFISFMSDGRARTDTTVVSEDIKKIKKVNDKVIVGITGSLRALEVIFDAIEKSDTFDKSNAETLLNSLFNVLVKETNEPLIVSTHFLVGGLDNNNRIYYGGFSNDSTQLTEVRASIPNQLLFATSGGEYCPFNPQEKLGELISLNVSKIKTADDVIMLQMALNQMVAENDDSVNTAIFHEYVQK